HLLDIGREVERARIVQADRAAGDLVQAHVQGGSRERLEPRELAEIEIEGRRQHALGDEAAPQSATGVAEEVRRVAKAELNADLAGLGAKTAHIAEKRILLPDRSRRRPLLRGLLGIVVVVGSGDATEESHDKDEKARQ